MDALTSFLGAFLGVIGVNLAGRLFYKSDRLEGERDTLLNLILDEIDSARTKSVKYWGGGVSETEASITCAFIVAAGTTLLEHCHDLFEDHPEFKAQTLEELRRFRRAMTGGEFGSPEVSMSYDRIVTIQEAASVLERTLRKRRLRLKRTLFT